MRRSHMPTFDRAKPLLGYSLARWRHRKDQQEVNETYWLSVLQADLLRKALPADATSTQDFVVSQGLRTDSTERVGQSTSDLVSELQSSRRWARFSGLFLATSALERYIAAAATAAQESDPLLIPGFPKRIEGVTLKKYGAQFAGIDTRPLVEGEWTARVAAFKRTFSQVPAVLEDNLGELEKIRRLRNAVAHDFAFDEPAQITPSALLIAGVRRERLPKRGLSHERFLAWLALLNSISKDVDAFLCSEYVGAYELISAKLDWQAAPDRYEKSLGITVDGHRRGLEGRFRHVIGQALAINFSGEYERSLDAFVRRL